jgi:hypothetical protein
MTPPSLAVAREILADAAAKARASGDPFNQIAASAIDVVLARLAEHGHEPTVRVPVIGEGDGPPIGSAQVGDGRATITMTVDVPADPGGRRPIEVMVGRVSVGYAPTPSASPLVETGQLDASGAWKPDATAAAAAIRADLEQRAGPAILRAMKGLATRPSRPRDSGRSPRWPLAA